MKIFYDGKPFGEMQISEQGQSVIFFAECRKTDRILRIWGISDGKEPVLIGIPEPDGNILSLKRRFTMQYMKDCGYEQLPERYIAGETIEQAFGEKRTYKELKCIFEPQKPFEFADKFCLCHIENGTAVIYQDIKNGRLMKKPPE